LTSPACASAVIIDEYGRSSGSSFDHGIAASIEAIIEHATILGVGSRHPGNRELTTPTASRL
jgi:hypothetical protein